ncbi:MAG: MiaB/RimO family radical SAM methylthiotransferase [Candidatus Omnitrophica bacterium]|nr:MiaB/RimO family radical SAM methylthiotransferase [Candidatus Omnitrophota bacterium]
MTPQTFFIRTFGCQMNSRDSELVTGLLLKHGYKLANSEQDADIILFNGCSVRAHAEEKVWSEIGKYKQRKAVSSHKLQVASHKQNSKTSKKDKKPVACNLEPAANKPIVGLLGCMAQNWQQAAFGRAPRLDLVVGPNNLSSLPELIGQIVKSQSIGLAVGGLKRDDKFYNTGYISKKEHANVIIMEGCDNYCSYCVVPYVRGHERSRPSGEIIREIKQLVKKGVKEITLLGQNVNSYSYKTQDARYKSQVASGKLQVASYKLPGEQQVQPETCNMKPVTFTELLRLVNEIEGLEKFDFVTSHPKDASIELFQAMAKLDKCRKFLHLPVQSGSDRILKQMNRGYTARHYIGLAEKARQIIPGLRLTTDVMVGFPGETEQDFQDTFRLMQQVKFDAAYIFKYSARPHTKAYALSDDVPLKVKKERNQILLEYQKKLHKTKTERGVKNGK